MTTAPISSTGTNIADLLNNKFAQTNGTGTNTPAPTGTDADTASLNTQYNQFLTLLTKQLQNQDPLSPMDTAQFTNQLVQFSSVEQQINQNKNLNQLISLQSSTNTYAAASFIGNTVAVNSDQLSLTGGKAGFQYQIEHQGDKALLRIADAQGHVVAIQEANSAVGTYQVQWNGQDASGNQLPDGQYQVSVQYEDSAGTNYSAPITVYGTVDSADVSNGQVSLNVGAVNYPVDKITKIIKPTAPASGSGSGTGSGSTGTGTDTGTGTTPAAA
jgi:flagellar basal-body rod modification protein FlgD